MAKNRLIEKIIKKKEEIKKVITKRVAPILLAGTITAGSLFGIAGCNNTQQQVDDNNNVNYEEVVGSQQAEINDLKEIINELKEEVDGLKTEVDTKADLKTINEINKELVSITKTLADLTNNIAAINDYYLSVKDKIDTTNTKVDKLETSLNEISKKYDEQQKVLNALVTQIQTLETKVNELLNTNNNISDNTTSDLQSQITEIEQAINRLALENIIHKTVNSRFNEIYISNAETDYSLYTSPNGDFCISINENNNWSWINAQDNFVCSLNYDGTNVINYGDCYNATQQFYVMIQGGFLSMNFEDYIITRDGNRFAVSMENRGKTITTYISVHNGFIYSIEVGDDLYYSRYRVNAISKDGYQTRSNACKIASKTYNDLKSIIENSWTDDCLVYSPFTEEVDEYGVYLNNEEAYMYENEAEDGETYGVADKNYIASITQTSSGKLELDEENGQYNIIQSLKNEILNNGENMLISYNAETNSYVIEDEDKVRIEYFVKNNEIVSIKVLDKVRNEEKECVKVISKEEFEQKAREIQAKFNELKAEYENANNLYQ